MEIIIIRHAEPNYEIDSLTEKGVKEAELLSKKMEKIDVAAFYCSPLGRAVATAKPTLEKMRREAEVLEWLREFEGRVDFGNNEKLPRCWDLMPSYWTNVDTYYSKDNWLQDKVMQSVNVEQEYQWVTSELDALLAKHGYVHEGNHFRVEKGNHDRIVFFCHYGVSCVMLAHILGISPVMFWQSFVMQPSSVTSLITEEREEGFAVFRMRTYGDVSHLYAGDEEPSFMARFCECYEDDTRH
jgi:probable phosphoglycerate mutase